MDKVETGEPAQNELTKSLVRALRVLDAIGDAGRPLGVTEIARRIGVHKSSVHRLLRTMVELDYLEQHGSTSEYWLGLRLSSLGQLATAHLELPRVARTHVERLSTRTHETANLAQLHGDRCLYLISVQTDQSIGIIAKEPGSTDSLQSTALGKAMLAHLAPHRAKDLLKRAEAGPKTAAAPRPLADFCELLPRIRSRGYAIDDRENDQNTRCIGAPIFDRRGTVVGAVSISGPEFRVTFESIEANAPFVMECAIDISEAIGLPPSDNPISPCLERLNVRLG